MAQIERLHDYPPDANVGLYILECGSFADIIPAVATLPGKHFVTLLIADFSSTTRDDLVSLSKQLIAAGSRYFCAWGQDCQTAHLAFDLARCEFERDTENVILTTDHSTESLDDAIWYALNVAYPVDPYDRDWHAIIAICVNDNIAGQTIRNAFTDPAEFSEHNGPTVDEDWEWEGEPRRARSRLMVKRLTLQVAVLLGSSLACCVGLATGIAFDTAFIAWISAATFPLVCVYVLGLRDGRQLVKLACYAAIGWTLCFVLAPARSESKESRARRIAADPLSGKGWYIHSTVASWIMLSVGIAFVPAHCLKSQTDRPSTS